MCPSWCCETLNESHWQLRLNTQKASLSNPENSSKAQCFSIHICRLIKKTGCCTNIRFGRHFKGLDTPCLRLDCCDVCCEDRLVLCDVNSSGVVDFSGSISLHWGTDSGSGNCFVGKTELLRLRESRWSNWPDETDKRERGRLWERWRRGGGRVGECKAVVFVLPLWWEIFSLKPECSTGRLALSKTALPGSYTHTMFFHTLI